MWITVVLAMSGASLAPFPRYQPIIDCKPFGEVSTPALDVETMTQSQEEEQQEKEAIAQKLNMCAVTIMPGGEVGIGFTDATVNPSSTYFLTQGKTVNGFTLISADYEDETATLQHNGLILTLKLGVGLVDTPVAVDSDSAVQGEQVPSPPPPSKLRTIRIQSQKQAIAETFAIEPISPPDSSQVAPKGGAKARLLARRAAEKAEADAINKQATKVLQDKMAMVAADKIKRERRVEIERIKRGEEPTIPLILTLEEDMELERAGVFDASPEDEGENETDREIDDLDGALDG